VALAPHVVTGIRVVASPRGSEVEITAEDGLALLGRATLADLWDRSGRSIRESLAALAGAAEVGYADGGEAALARTVARCMLRPGEPVAGLVRDLLALAGAVALCDDSGVLRARVLVPWFPLAAEVGAQGEVLRGVYGRAMPAETEWRVWGEGLAAAAPPGEDAMTLGLSFVRHAVDHRATTEELAAEIAGWRALLTALGARAERVTVPLRPDLEVWDRVALTAPPYVVAGDDTRRVLGVEEEYAPARGVYESTLALAWGE